MAYSKRTVVRECLRLMRLEARRLRLQLSRAQQRVDNSQCAICGGDLSCGLHGPEEQACYCDYLAEGATELEYEIYLATHPMVRDRREGDGV